jgi:hypothetical protein
MDTSNQIIPPMDPIHKQLLFDGAQTLARMINPTTVGFQNISQLVQLIVILLLIISAATLYAGQNDSIK